MPQAPQFEVSLPVSTQEAPHFVLPPQAIMHAPPWQTMLAAQAFAQAPQFAESELSSTHLPLHLL